MGRCRQRGATLVLVTVGLLALIAVAGLAIDTSCPFIKSCFEI